MTAQQRTLLTLKRDGTRDNPALEERLHKVLAHAGLGSRRVLEKRIEQGDITVNGAVAETGCSVHAGDRVALDNHQFVVATDTHENDQVILYNKPEGELVTRHDEEGRPTVFEQLPRPTGAGRWIAIGRLDINTTGLLLLTNNGDLANALMHPSNAIEREYLCRIRGDVADATLELLKAGIELEDGPARFDDIIVVSREGSHAWFRVILSEGRNREVRRLWDSQELTVSRLKRIRYGNTQLPRPLRRGKFEILDEEAVKALKKTAGLSNPPPVLTLAPVVRERRVPRHVTEFHPDQKNQANAWLGASQSEARELTAYDRVREDSPRGGRRGSGKKRTRGDVNGNVAPSAAGKPRNRKNKRSVAPGQELPSVRTWFAGDDRKPGGQGKNKSGKARNNHRNNNKR